MAEFLFLFRGGDPDMTKQSPADWQAHMQKWMQWMSDLNEEGKFIGAQPLSNSGKTIQGKNKIISDGPFMEGKEIVGGYMMCKADDFLQAVEISKGCPILEFDDGIVEVREIREMKM